MKTMTMIFNCAGMDSEEELDVMRLDGDIVTLDTDDDIDECKKFNIKTGECLNDDTTFGASRRLKIWIMTHLWKSQEVYTFDMPPGRTEGVHGKNIYVKLEL